MNSNQLTVKMEQQRSPPVTYLKLAEEIDLTEHCESDSSCYDSLNEMETGLYTLVF